MSGKQTYQEVTVDETAQAHTTDNIPQLQQEKDNGKRTTKYLVFGAAIVACFVILIIIGVIVGFQVTPTKNESKQSSQDLVVSIMEEPVQCLLDEHCTSFTFNDSAVSKIRQVFNEYDGDEDDLWTKDEFITFYIESLDGGDAIDAFGSMDFDSDNVWSYKEAVIYFLLVKDVPLIKNSMYPVLEQAIKLVYGYNSTLYDDQLFWEYAVELMFVELDEYQQGFVTKKRYFERMATIEFDAFAKQDKDHETITFEEFFQSRFGQENMDSFVNTDTEKMSHEYEHLSVSLNKSHTLSLLSSFELKHCLYSTIDFESLRRRLSSLWDCAVNIAGCLGTGAASVAFCLMTVSGGWTWPFVWSVCGGGGAASTAVCSNAYDICDAWWNS